MAKDKNPQQIEYLRNAANESQNLIPPIFRPRHFQKQNQRARKISGKQNHRELEEKENEGDESQNLIPSMEENDQQNQQELEEKESEVGELKKQLAVSREERLDLRTRLKKQGVIEEKNMHVGPIWANYEADEKVKAFMLKNNMFEEGWHWTGHWCSDHGTSYADFWRLKNDFGL